MIVLVARYSAKTGRGDEVAGWLGEMASRVERDEETCLVYEVSRSPDQPDEFVLYEWYPDDSAVEAHRATEHYREIIEGKVVPNLEERRVEFYSPLSMMRRTHEGQQA